MEVSSPLETEFFFGHKEQESFLLRLIQQNKLPHGLLFTGPRGVGKATCAYRLARGLFLKDRQGSLDSFDMASDHSIFRTMVQGSHGDFKDILSKKNADISIEEIRDIAHFLHQTPLEGNIRCVVIEEAERLTLQATNALLKSLEEPPAQAYLLLCTNKEQMLLPTLKSRLQKIQFSYLKNEEEESVLMRLFPEEKERKDLKKSSAFKGAPGQLLLYKHMGGDSFYESLKEVLQTMRQKKEVLYPHAYIEKYFSKEKEGNNLSFEEKVFVFLSLLRTLLFTDTTSSLWSLPEEQKVEVWRQVHLLLTETDKYDLEPKQTWALVFQKIGSFVVS